MCVHVVCRGQRVSGVLSSFLNLEAPSPAKLVASKPHNHPVLIPLCSSTGLHRATLGFYVDARIRTLVLMNE